MKDPSDINLLHSEVIFLKMRKKSTEELISIWVENNHKAWGQEEFVAIQRVLVERLGKIPEQTNRQEATVTQPKNNKAVSDDRLWQPFFNLSPKNNLRVLLWLVGIICLCSASILSTMVKQNTKTFWDFAKTVTPSEITKIEIQRLDRNSEGIGNIVTISDKNNIRDFVSILRTIQDYREYHPSPINIVRIKIWRIKKYAFWSQEATIELECYTMDNEGNTLFVGAIWVNPSAYIYGNGDAKFLEPDLFDWLKKNGISFH